MPIGSILGSGVPESAYDAGSEPGDHHELVRVFSKHDIALNKTLVEMLNEHYSHRTERRGCGYTQASRHLAVLVNAPPEQQAETMAKLFPAWVRAQALTSDALSEAATEKLHTLIELLEREESRLLAAIIADLVRPDATGAPELPSYLGEIKVGTCPLAEKYFLEITERFVRRRGRANVIVSDDGEPLLVEKVNLGDSHSCVSVSELILHGVRLPSGCLFGVSYEGDVGERDNRALPGSVIPLRRCEGFRFLRLTTLAVSPENRQRAFTSHFAAQVKAPLYRPGHATIEQLRRVATEQL